MLLKEGDRGQEVAEVQKLLSLLGYDLIVDADFGKRTTRSIKAFQKKIGLVVDGVVGDKTHLALKVAQKRTSKEIKGAELSGTYEGIDVVTGTQLSNGQYIKQVFDKNQIYIHFTAGSGSAKNVIRYWDGNDPRIATAFIIDGNDGSLWEAFNPDYWSFHLGVKGTKGKLDKHSIGIEICSYGPLKKKGDKYYAWPRDYTTEVSSDRVFELSEPWRGFKYFHAYTDAQMESLENLLNFLVEKYNIDIQESFDMDWFDFKQEVIKERPSGIWTHVNVRKDKTDSYPDQKMLDLLNRVAQKQRSNG